MHEYSLVQALVERVEQEAARRGALAVHRLRVRIGELSGVEADLFVTAYETFREGTICAKAELAVERVPASWSCPGCGRRIARGAPLQCPACQQAARLDDGGDSLVLDRIELEVE